jgi:hypothetical protein
VQCVRDSVYCSVQYSVPVNNTVYFRDAAPLSHCVSYVFFRWVPLQVKPELDVLDYHTEFSGITKEALLPVRLLCYLCA